jgi:fatty-acyl-CoA synthase
MTGQSPTSSGTFTEQLLLRSQSDGVALLFEDQSWTWAEYIAECQRRASLWSSLRDPSALPHLGILLDNVPDYLFWLGAGALAGATVVGINSTYRGAELAGLISHTDCQILVTEGRHRALLDQIDLSLPHSNIVDIDDPSYHEALTAAPTAATATPVAEDLFLLIFTSGSTAAPKAVRCTQGRLATTGIHVASIAQLGPDDVVYPPLPLFHSSALFTAWSSAVHVGAAVVLRRRFSASGFLPDVRRYGVTFVAYTGKVLNYILATPELENDSENSVRLAVGNEASEADLANFARRYGCHVRDSYGATEGLIIVRRSPDMPAGALGVGGEGVEVFDPETGMATEDAEFGPGGRLVNEEAATGELVQVHPEQLFEGYYRNPEAERARLRDGVFWSGDLAYRDADGWIYFVGRDNDWLRVDGENFAARPVERILGEYRAIRSAAVYAVPDRAVGDRVMAAIDLQAGETFDAEGFDGFLDGHSDLSPKWRPRFVRVMEAVPVLASLKVDKRLLRRQAWECADPVWWRPTGRDPLVLLDAAGKSQLRGLLPPL